MTSRNSVEQAAPCHGIHALVAPAVATLTLMTLGRFEPDLHTLIAVSFVSFLTATAIALFIERPPMATRSSVQCIGSGDGLLLEMSAQAVLAPAITWALCVY